MDRTLLYNVQLVKDRKISPAEILIEDGTIAWIDRPYSLPASLRNDPSLCLIDGEGRYVSHGFIDIHTHGGGGHDFMDAARQAYLGAAKLHAQHGTTALLPTTLSGSFDELLKTFEVYESVKDQTEGARFLGLHLEGPYISLNQAGAQDPKYIKDPDPSEYRAIVEACPHILRWTIAPERQGAFLMAEYLREHGITPSIGHSDATLEEVEEAVRHGFNHITHLYSCCSTITRRGGYRFPGIIESAYLLEDLTVEVIADGHHLPSSLLQMVYRFIGPERTCAVTDSLRGAGMPDGESILGSLAKGQKVIIEDGVCKLPDRSAFAGSVATSDTLVRNLIALMGADLPTAVDMQTRVAAQILGLSESVGTLEKGRKADLVLFDESIHVSLTMVGGKILFEKRTEP